MKSTISLPGLWKIDHGQQGATLKALQDEGVTLAHLARLRRDKEYSRYVAKAFKTSMPSESQMEARRCMGDNYFGPEEWANHLGVDLSGAERRVFGLFPWSEKELNAPCPFTPGKRVRETHFAFAASNHLDATGVGGYPMCLKSLYILYYHLKTLEFHRVMGNEPWPVREPFGQVCLEHGWYLVFVGQPPENFSGKAYSDQVALLPFGYEVPSAIEQTTAYWLMNAAGLQPTDVPNGVVCKDVWAPGNDHVAVGFSEGWGLDFWKRNPVPDDKGFCCAIGAVKKHIVTNQL